MNQPSLTLPVLQLLNLGTLFICLLAAAYFLWRLPIARGKFLIAAVLLIMATIKIDEVYQMSGGLQHSPAYAFVFSPLQWLMAPLLYLYVRAVTGATKGLRVRDSIHGVPFLLVTAFYMTTFYLLPVAEKQALLESGWLQTPLHRLALPLLGDAQQIAYIGAALVALKRYGLRLKDLFANLEAVEKSWLRRLLLLWVTIFTLHFAWVLARFFTVPAVVNWATLIVMDVLHLLLSLAFVGYAQMEAFRDSGRIKGIEEPRSARGNLQLPDRERAAAFERLQQYFEAEAPYLNPGISLAGLADALALTPRELSEVINREAGRNFFDYVNAHRIEAGKRLLAENPTMTVIEVAYACGFNSKSAFNDSFKKHTGLTPTAFRKQTTDS